MKTLKEHIIAKLSKEPEYWHDVDTYSADGKTRYQIECRVDNVTESNYLCVVSGALSIASKAMENNSGIDCHFEIRGFASSFRVVFTFWED